LAMDGPKEPWLEETAARRVAAVVVVAAAWEAELALWYPAHSEVSRPSRS
jgi:hypothetical protein